MLRLILLPLALMLPLQACNSESVATKQHADPVNIMVASSPAGATVLMQDAKIGKTPMTISVRQTTPVKLQLEGYEPQQLFVDPQGQMNLIVTLTPKPKPAVEPSTSTSSAKPTTAQASTSQTHYTFTSLKKLYRAGELDKIEYNQQVTRLKHAQKAELNDLKAKYRRGELDKLDYEQQVRKIKFKYNG